MRSHVRWVTIDWKNVNVHGRRKPPTFEDQAKSVIIQQDIEKRPYFNRSLVKPPLS